MSSELSILDEFRMHQKEGNDLYRSFVKISKMLFEDIGKELKIRQGLQQQFLNYIHVVSDIIDQALIARRRGLVLKEYDTIEMVRLKLVRKFYDEAVHTSMQEADVVLDGMRLFRQMDYELFEWEKRFIAMIRH